MMKRRRIEYLGWGFFGLVLVCAIPPSIFFLYQITHDGVTTGTRVGTGITVAFFIAAFSSWAANGLLQLRNRRMDDQDGADPGPPNE